MRRIEVALSWALGVGCCIAAVARGAIRESADYGIETEASGCTGGASASASYALEGVADACVGAGTNGATAEVVRHGYVGQQGDVVAVGVHAAPASMNEGATREAAAVATLDDATVLVLRGAEADWSVDGWPLAGVAADGLVTAATVFAPTSGVVRAFYAGTGGNLRLTVLNQLDDNFGSYAADGLDDGWQAVWFGLDNPDAAPTADSDGDDQNNRYERTTGTDPTDGNSRFRFWMERVAGHPTYWDLCFSPLRPGRTYTLESRTSLLSGDWAMQPCAIRDTGEERTMTDTSAADPSKLYRVRIQQP